MPEILKLSSDKVKDWLEKETGSALSPVHVKAEKMLNEMQKALNDVENACKTLLEKSRKKIENGNRKIRGRARGLNKLSRIFLERIQLINVPDEISYDNLNDFIQETQRTFIVTEIDIRNWFPKISPFFILDRRKFLTAFEKAKETLKELQSFLTKKYVKIKTLEETFQHLDQLMALERQLTELETDRSRIQAERVSIEKQIAQKQQEIKVLKESERLAQLNRINMEIEKLRSEVKHHLRHLQKPFVKFQWLVSHKGGLTPEELKKLNQYIENPFDALTTEKEGCPMLKQILQKLNRLISEGKLKLKPSKKRKAEKTINEILNKNSLHSLHQKCKNTITLKKQLSTSTETIEAKETLSKLKETLKELERKKRLNITQENRIEQRFKETLKKIHSQKEVIEKNVFELTRKKVTIEQSLSNIKKLR